MSVPEFMMNFFGDLTSFEGKTDEGESRPFQKETNTRKATKVYYGERPMTRADASYMKAHFNEESLMEKVDGLDECVQQNLADEFVGYGIETDLYKLPKTMCEMFRSFMSEMSVRKTDKRQKSTVKQNCPGCPSNEESKDKSVSKKPEFESSTMALARKFCLDYEDQKKFLVLCQIADYIDPLHKHVRTMYTEYLRQDDEVKRAIMHLNNIPMLEFEPDWEYSYLDEFRKDIKALELVTEKDLLYEGGKYFHRARNYAKLIIREKNPRIFPAVPTRVRRDFFKPPYKDDLLNFIDEYLYYRNDEDTFKYVSVPPFDWMIEYLDLLNCSEESLTYWMCMFIWSACYIIPREITSRQKKVMERDEDENSLYYPSPTIDDIENMEDLYYYTLYVLYNLYSRN